MRWARRIVALVLVLAFAGLLWSALGSDDSGEAPASAATVDLTSSTSCRSCHPEVYAEWETSFHAQSFTDPLVRAKEQSNNFRKLACIPCHAPAPVLEHGIGKDARVVDRISYREQGVDCLACHKVGDRVAASRTVAAPCRPRHVPELTDAALCAPCHNQHQTIDEWEASVFSDRGIGCLDCHMPEVERSIPGGGSRRGRAHTFPGGHHPPTLRESLDVLAETREAADGDRLLVVSLTNHGAGHNYPADARHRALDLVVTLVGRDGLEIPAREARAPGQERGTARRRFQNPYRGSPEERENEERYGRANMQIRSGETVALEVPYSSQAVAQARVEVLYKLTPLVPDGEGTVVHAQTVDL